MNNLFNPDAPAYTGNWMSNTYAPLNACASTFSIGYNQNPFATNDASRRNMNQNITPPPVFGTNTMQNTMMQPTTPQIQPFGSYPPTAQPTQFGFNQLAAQTQTNGNSASMSQNNPWANPVNQPQLNMGNMATNNNVPNMGFNTTLTPAISSYDFSSAWDKRNGSPWPQSEPVQLSAPVINWNQYQNNSHPNVNGYYAPIGSNVPQAQYPVNYNTPAVSSDWSVLCETNFKAQF